MHVRQSIPLFVALAALACTKKPEVKPEPVATTPPAPAAPAAPPPPATKTVTLADVGLDGAAMDRTLDPCDDFYQYACGTWLKTTPIPGDKNRWSRSFSVIDKENDETLKAVLEEAPKSQDPGEQKLGAFYAACMDEAGIEKAGIQPISKLLGTIKGIKDVPTLQNALLELHKVRITVPFNVDAEQDMKDATKMIFGIDQGGLGLPDRDYYVKDDEKSKDLRAKYVEHVGRMLQLLGEKPADAKKGADAILALETELAKVSLTRVERRDPQKLYNKIDKDGVIKAAPTFPWNAYFTSLGRPDIVDINVASPAFLEGMNKLLSSQKSDAWRAYLSYHTARSLADQLPKAFQDEKFKLQQALTGQKEIEPRWKRCVDATDAALGELLAQPFVKKKFGGDSKQATEQMVLEISKAFGAGLDKLDWMDAPTRQRAHEKLKAFAYHIGYPVKWKEYAWNVQPSYAQNVLTSRNYELQRDLTKIGKPVDREEWDMTPPTVNAYYNPQKNEMVFPAGILQPPFYSQKASVAVNMGGMGMVVGHELTHGFDDEGSQFAADGNLKSWWEEPTRAKFDQKTQCIADQYGQYEPIPGVRLNGKLTLGENIADNGGVKLSFRAYRELRKNANEKLVADGFNEDQQFFLAVGQAWCTNATEEIQRMLANVDPHSPPRFRVNGSLSNTPEFWEAFACKEGTKMHPANACQVW